MLKLRFKIIWKKAGVAFRTINNLYSINIQQLPWMPAISSQ